MKEVKNDTKRWEDIPCFWIGRISVVKMTVPPKAILAIMKEVKNDTKRWEDIPCSWIGRISVVKMTVPPKATLAIFKCIIQYY